jgi:hypothetical protein
MIFEPQRTVFAILSFEGPDVYSQAGGLGVRVKGLSRTLAQLGYQAYLYFCGDPDLPGEESHRADPRLPAPTAAPEAPGAPPRSLG